MSAWALVVLSPHSPSSDYWGCFFVDVPEVGTQCPSFLVDGVIWWLSNARDSHMSCLTSMLPCHELVSSTSTHPYLFASISIFTLTTLAQPFFCSNLMLPKLFTSTSLVRLNSNFISRTSLKTSTHPFLNSALRSLV